MANNKRVGLSLGLREDVKPQLVEDLWGVIGRILQRRRGGANMVERAMRAACGLGWRLRARSRVMCIGPMFFFDSHSGVHRIRY